MSKITSIGGQAVIEGVMMRNKNKYALAVRNSKGKIEIETHVVNSMFNSKFFSLPIIRGIVAFVDSLVLGTKLITRSAELAGLDDEQPSKFEVFLTEKIGLGDKLNNILIFFSVFLAMLLGTFLFMIAPVAIAGFIGTLFPIPQLLISTLEGVVRLLIFLCYIFLISKNKDIQRVFMYHGAEHKTINCFEANEALTVENVKKHSTLHKRCGTSFLLIVMVISSIFFMFLKTDDVLMRIVNRIIFLPIVAGISYEFLKFTGKSNNKFINALILPGLKLQNLTTREPDNSQIEVAIKSTEAIL